MTEYLTADSTEELWTKYNDVRESQLLADAHDDAEEFGGGCSLRFYTSNRKVPPGTVEMLCDLGLGAEYIGQNENGLHAWALIK